MSARESTPRPASQDDSHAREAATRDAQELAEPLVVFLGDSLTAGYGVPQDQAFPALVGARLRAEGFTVRVVNAGVSGDTSAGGLGRLDWILHQKPNIVVVEFGANDALRGQPIGNVEKNLRAIIQRTKDAGVSVLLAGMRIPTNYGPEYASRFESIYPRLARSLDVPLVPFLLEGVGGHAELNLADGIHPTPAGHEIVADNVLPYIEKMLAEKMLVRPSGTPDLSR